MGKPKANKIERSQVYEYAVHSGENVIEIEANHYAYNNEGLLNFYLTEPLKMIATFKNWDSVKECDEFTSS